MRCARLAGDATGIIDNGNKIGIGAAGRRMEFDKAHPYLLGEIKKQPLNGELHLRAGNIARKMNLHEEAIKHYRRALELKPRLIAAAYNLFILFGHRHEYYEIPGAEENAVFYLKEMRRLYDSKDYDSATIAEPQIIVDMLREKEIKHGLSKQFTKINEDDIRAVLTGSSTHDVAEITRNLTKQTKAMKDQTKALIDEAKGVIVMQSYHIFDKKAEIAKSLLSRRSCRSSRINHASAAQESHWLSAVCKKSE